MCIYVRDYVAWERALIERSQPRKNMTNINAEIRVGNCYLGVLAKAECPCSWSSVVRSAASLAASATRWRSAARWPASDWAAIDLDLSTVLGRSACSVSVIYSSANAWWICKLVLGTLYYYSLFVHLTTIQYNFINFSILLISLSLFTFGNVWSPRDCKSIRSHLTCIDRWLCPELDSPPSSDDSELDARGCSFVSTLTFLLAL